MTSELWRSTARDLSRRIAAGEVSAIDATEAFIARIEAVDGAINAVVWRRFDAARAEARAIDASRAAGKPLGPLAGVPITIKECLALEGSPATFGATEHKNDIARADEPAVAALRNAGAVILGKTNVSQLLLFMETDNPVYGRTNHPSNPERSPGGSSGGQAAIVAAGGAALGLGTDIGGSSRNPAAACGVVGFKPTAGVLPDRGQGSVAPEQQAVASQLGIIARDADDAALALAITSGRSVDLESVDVAKLSIGWFDDDGIFPSTTAARRAVAEAMRALEARGARVVPWSIADPRRFFRLFYGALTADRGASWRRFLGKGARDRRVAELELAATKPRWLIELVLALTNRRATRAVIDAFASGKAADYFRVVREIEDLRAETLAALGPIDALVSPASALPALRHGASQEVGTMGIYTTMYNVLGWPAGVVPVTRVLKSEESDRVASKDPRDRVARKTELGSAGLPIAVQVAARPGNDHVALAVMRAIRPFAP